MDGRAIISGGPAPTASAAACDFPGEPVWTRERDFSRARSSAGVLAAEPPVPAGTAVGALPPPEPPLLLPPPLLAFNWAWASARCDCSRDRNDFAYETTLELLPWLISCCVPAMDCW